MPQRNFKRVRRASCFGLVRPFLRPEDVNSSVYASHFYAFHIFRIKYAKILKVHICFAYKK